MKHPVRLVKALGKPYWNAAAALPTRELAMIIAGDATGQPAGSTESEIPFKSAARERR